MEKNNRDFIEKLVHINRITKVVKGGRRFGFSALVVVGNQNGQIGIAHAKAKQVPDAIKKANELARRKLIKSLQYNILSVYKAGFSKGYQLSQMTIYPYGLWRIVSMLGIFGYLE